MGVTSERRSGVLLHPSSLPGDAVGDLGAAAYRWVDWLALAGQTLWQILPLGAVGEGGSPYHGRSAFAGHVQLLSADLLVEDGLLDEDEARPPAGAHPSGPADFSLAERWKQELVRRAHAGFRAGASPGLAAGFAEFRTREGFWLEDWCLFRALREAQGGACWTQWPAPLAHRDVAALEEARQRLADEIEAHALGQFLFDRQWGELRRYAAERGVRVIGDVPIFVAHDSADVWAHARYFALDARGEPSLVSGVPPDYFSETGQLWGNPLYRWKQMRADGYRWWVERFRRTLGLVDIARIDHFRGFESYWEVAADEETALNGRWVPAPGEELFDAVQAALGRLPLIAEDLGLITPEVEALRAKLGFPGMRVLQFAWGDPDPENPHRPENYPADAIAYPGTHDNNTALAWYRDEATPSDRAGLAQASGGEPEEPGWAMIEVVLESRAAVVIIPLQDVLELGAEARMNTPGSTQGNWAWRFAEGDPSAQMAARLRDLTAKSGRLHGEERR
jgi:4-alpha-glucanotransferase